MKCSCGSEWFLEQRLIQPGVLSTDARLQSLPKATMYRLVCAECGATLNTEENPDG